MQRVLHNLKNRPRFAVILLVVIVLVAALVLLLVRILTQSEPAIVDNLGGESFIRAFHQGHDEENWYIADMYYPSESHLAAWVPENVHFLENRMELELNRKQVAYKPYSGGEYHKRGFYHYGRYEVVMQAAPGEGTVSSFFTHTGDYFGDPHDEIDIEFLGKNTHELHINYFTDGKSAGSIYIPLDYDAAEEPHLYRFDWLPDRIDWYVDNDLVFTADERLHPLPSHPGRIIMDLWSGSPRQYNWHGEPNFEDGTRAKYYCVSFLKDGETGTNCADKFKILGNEFYFEGERLTN